MRSARLDAAEHRVDTRVVRTRKDVLRATLEVLIDEGWESVTHQHIARVAGYAKATVYMHWPTRSNLLRDAFTVLVEMRHHTPTGDLRVDLMQELTAFRTAFREQRLDRAWAVLSDLTISVPELIDVRDLLVADGEHLLRQLLESVLQGGELDAATSMLCGAIVHAALMHGQSPGDDVLAAMVDLILRGVDATAPR